MVCGERSRPTKSNNRYSPPRANRAVAGATYTDSNPILSQLLPFPAFYLSYVPHARARATGDDVTQLQQYLGVSPTGYFGTATARAVTAVQADAGLSQIGIVGPATRMDLQALRRGGWNQNFSASPTSGQAPCRTRATVSGGEYKVDGDGTSRPLRRLVPAESCNGRSLLAPGRITPTLRRIRPDFYKGRPAR